MLGRIPAAAREDAAPLALDQTVFGLHAVPRMLVRQLGNPQLHRRNLRQAKISFAQRRLDDGEPGHDPIEIDFGLVGAAQQPFEIASRAHGVTPAAALDQRRAPEEQSVLGTGEP
jgi:hypothetical protein